jgi:hypothetical protein
MPQDRLTAKQLLTHPEFRTLSPEAKRILLEEASPEFSNMSEAGKVELLSSYSAPPSAAAPAPTPATVTTPQQAAPPPDPNFPIPGESVVPGLRGMPLPGMPEPPNPIEQASMDVGFFDTPKEYQKIDNRAAFTGAFGQTAGGALDAANRGVVGGMAATGKGAARLVQMTGQQLGKVPGSTGVAGKALEMAGATVGDSLVNVQQAPDVKPDPAIHGADPFKSPEVLADPRWWAYAGGQALGSTLPTIGVGMAAQGMANPATIRAAQWATAKGLPRLAQLMPGLVGAAVSAGVETLTDAPNLYDEVMVDLAKSGASIQEAQDTAALVTARAMLLEMPVTAVFNKLGLFNDKIKARSVRAALGLVTEGLQEGSQGVSQKLAQQQTYAPQKPIWNEFGSDFAAGAVGGATTGAILSAPDSLEAPQAPPPAGSQQQAPPPAAPPPPPAPAAQPAAPVVTDDLYQRAVAAIQGKPKAGNNLGRDLGVDKDTTAAIFARLEQDGHVQRKQDKSGRPYYAVVPQAAPAQQAPAAPVQPEAPAQIENVQPAPEPQVAQPPATSEPPVTNPAQNIPQNIPTPAPPAPAPPPQQPQQEAEEPTFTARMAAAKDANEGRALIKQHADTINSLMREIGIPPIVGRIEENYAVGFSVVSSKAWASSIKQARSIDTAKADRLQALVDDGKSMAVPFSTLLENEYKDKGYTVQAPNTSPEDAAPAPAATADLADTPDVGEQPAPAPDLQPPSSPETSAAPPSREEVIQPTPASTEGGTQGEIKQPKILTPFESADYFVKKIVNAQERHYARQYLLHLEGKAPLPADAGGATSGMWKDLTPRQTKGLRDHINIIYNAPATRTPKPAADGDTRPDFKRGERVSFTNMKGEKLTGTVRSDWESDLDDYVQVDVDQIAKPGGVPIGRIENWPPARIQKIDAQQGEAPTPPADQPPPPASVEEKPSAEKYDELHWQIKDLTSRPHYKLDTEEGRKLRDRVVDLEREREFHRPAAEAKQQAIIDKEKKATAPADSPAPPASIEVDTDLERQIVEAEGDMRQAKAEFDDLTTEDAESEYANQSIGRAAKRYNDAARRADELRGKSSEKNQLLAEQPDGRAGKLEIPKYVAAWAHDNLTQQYADLGKDIDGLREQRKEPVNPKSKHDFTAMAGERLQAAIEQAKETLNENDWAPDETLIKDLGDLIAEAEKELSLAPTPDSAPSNEEQKQEEPAAAPAPEDTPAAPQSVEVAEREEKTKRTVEAIQKELGSVPSGLKTRFWNVVEAAWGAARQSGEYTAKQAYEMLEAGVNRYIGKAKWLLDDGREVDALRVIRDIMGRLPTQSVRTEEQNTFQQFSTPPIEAWLVDKLAVPQSDDIALEPSAGNGGLVVMLASKVKEVHANEIDPWRREMLRQVGIEEENITDVDAEKIHAMLSHRGSELKPTLIVMNPPFSATGGRVKTNKNKYGYAHVLSALQRLAPGGRLVAILGEGARLGAPNAKEFYAKIQKDASLRVNIGIDGKEYAKYGTTFGNRIIVIDKVTPGGWRELTDDEIEKAEQLVGKRIRLHSWGRSVEHGPAAVTITRVTAKAVEFSNIQYADGTHEDAGAWMRSNFEITRNDIAEEASTPLTGEYNSIEEAYNALKPFIEEGRPAPGRSVDGGKQSSQPGGGEVSAGLPGRSGDGQGRPVAGVPSGGEQPGGSASIDEGGGERPNGRPQGTRGGRQGTGGRSSDSGSRQDSRPVTPPTEADITKKASELLADKKADALKRLQEKMRGQRLGSGIDPQDIADLATVTADYVLQNAMAFKDWSGRVMRDMSELIEEYAAKAKVSVNELLREIHDAALEMAQSLRAEALRVLGGEKEAPRDEPEQKQAEPEDEGPSLGPVELNKDTSEAIEDDSNYVIYRPTIDGPAHPDALVETKVMASIEPPEISYTPNLPDSVVSEGRLSAAQLETVARAGMMHSQVDTGGFRRGFLLGDGTGVGKGRQIAAIIWDNWRQGRKRAAWLSASAGLVEQAGVDFGSEDGIGADDLAKKLHLWNDVAGPAEAIDKPEGVIFGTYSIFSQQFRENKENADRFKQLVDWLGEDGVVILDEAHKGKNAYGERGTTATGEAIIALQEKNPKLRIVYASATFATEVRHLSYLQRLGLWGQGTSFESFESFLSQMASGGVAAMEMVARELKSMGRYLSRSISFKGVAFNEKTHELTMEQRRAYDVAAQAWQSTLEMMRNQIEENGARRSDFDSLHGGQFWSQQQRFFRDLLTAMKMPTLISMVDEAMADGRSVVISLIGTGEARANRSAQRAMANPDEDLDMSPREILVDLIRKHFPVALWEEYSEVGEDGRVTINRRIVRDEKGNPVVNPEAVEKRKALINKVQTTIDLPESPLDQIINTFGRDKVAELTGRTHFVRRNENGTVEKVKRAPDNVKAKDINKYEMGLFQGGKKRIAVISKAAGTGVSLHASKKAKNQQPRLHIALELSWSADDQMQSFGRTHRSNQKQAPEYIILSSDIGGERRFSSTIARRLEALGAMTKGQRTASGGDVLLKYNYETDQGQAAARAFYEGLLEGYEVPGSELDAMSALRGMGVLSENEAGEQSVRERDFENVTRLLNRIMMLETKDQNAYFEYFMNLFDAAMQRAIEAGTLDTGVRRVEGDEIRVVNEKTIRTDPDSGAKTVRYDIEVDTTPRPFSIDDLRHMVTSNADWHLLRGADGQMFVGTRSTVTLTNARTGAVERAWRLVPIDNGQDSHGAMLSRYVAESRIGQDIKRVYAEEQRKYEEARASADAAKKSLDSAKDRVKIGVLQESSLGYYKQSVERADAERKAAFAKFKEARDKGQYEEARKFLANAPTKITTTQTIIGGSVLPVWGQITVEGERPDIRLAYPVGRPSIVGVVVPSMRAQNLERALTGQRPAGRESGQILDAVLGGERVEIGGRQFLRRETVQRRPVVAINATNDAAIAWLRSIGVIREQIGWQWVNYLPADRARATAILDQILERYPVVESEDAGAGEARTPPSFNPGVGFGGAQTIENVAKYLVERLMDAMRRTGRAARRTWSAIPGSPTTGVGLGSFQSFFEHKRAPAPDGKQAQEMKPRVITKKQLRAIKTAASKLDIPDARYRALLRELGGVDSATDLMREGATAVIKALNQTDKNGRPLLLDSVPDSAFRKALYGLSAGAIDPTRAVTSPSVVMANSAAAKRIWENADRDVRWQSELFGKMMRHKERVLKGISSDDKKRIKVYRDTMQLLRQDAGVDEEGKPVAKDPLARAKMYLKLQGFEQSALDEIQGGTFLSDKLRDVNQKVTDFVTKPMHSRMVADGIIQEERYFEDYLPFFHDKMLSKSAPSPSELMEHAATLAADLNIPVDVAEHILKNSLSKKVKFGPIDMERKMFSLPGSMSLDDVLDLYIKGYARKRSMTRFVKTSEGLVKKIADPALREYTRAWWNQFMGRPDEATKRFASWLYLQGEKNPKTRVALAKALKLFGITEGEADIISPQMVASLLTSTQYMAKIGFNAWSPIQNLSQGINVYAKTGGVNTAIGYARATSAALSSPTMARMLLAGVLPNHMNPLRREIVRLRRAGVLDSFTMKYDQPIHSIHGIRGKVGAAATGVFQATEQYNRMASFFAGHTMAVRAGRGEKEAIQSGRDLTRITHFFSGRLDGVLWSRPPMGRAFLQFKSYTIKQIEFFFRNANGKEKMRFLWATLLMGGPASFGILGILRAIAPDWYEDEDVQRVLESWNLSALLGADKLARSLGVYVFPAAEGLDEYTATWNLFKWFGGPTVNAILDSLVTAYQVGNNWSEKEARSRAIERLREALIRSFAPGGVQINRVWRALEKVNPIEQPEEFLRQFSGITGSKRAAKP